MAWINVEKMDLFVSCIFVFALAPNIVGEVPRPRGTSISKAPLYVPGSHFACLDGSATIPFDRVNDDYCDCNDGSDEPGTSACSNGFFHCTNAGYKPRNIPSSWVNDGVCDCCDGTDEYENPKCQNNCKELGKEMREEGERRAQLLKEGHTIYTDYTQKGKQAKTEQEAKKVQLEKEREELDVSRTELEAVKNEVEKPETEAKDRHKKLWEEEKERRNAEKEANRANDAFNHLDVNKDSSLASDEIRLHMEFDIDSNGEVSYEEAKEYLEDHDAVDAAFFTEKVWPNIKEIYREKEEPLTTGDDESAKSEDDAPPTEEVIPEEPMPEVTEGYPDDYNTDDDMDDEDEEDDEELEEREDEPLQDPEDYDDHYHGDTDEEEMNDEHYNGVDADADADADASKDEEEDQMPEYDEETKALIAAADKARAEYDDADRKLRDLENELSEIKKFMELDLGPNLEYYALKGECFEYTDREYTYKLCPFDRASQRPKNGGSETSLGTWGRWAGGDKNIYSVMKFEKGQNCWNGPDRSCTVIVSCGKDNELLAVSEPNRCEYEYKFTTPAACNALPKIEDIHDEL